MGALFGPAGASSLLAPPLRVAGQDGLEGRPVVQREAAKLLFGATISTSETVPSPFAAAFFALYGRGWGSSTSRQRGWRPCSPEPAGYLGQGVALLVLFVASFFALALALVAFFGAASYAATLTLAGCSASFFSLVLTRQKVPLSLDGSSLDGTGFAVREAGKG